MVDLSAAEVEKMREVTASVGTEWIAEMDGLGKDGQALMDDANALLDKYGK